MYGLFGAALLATLGSFETPLPAPPGIVVERAIPGYEAAKAGIQAGDVLVSWERAANPPANAAPATGVFGSPFDVPEVFFEQGPRARTLMLGLMREGRKLSVPIGQYPWRLETRPAFSARWLARYEEGSRLIEQGELARGSDLWRALAGELSAAKRHVDAAWLWLRVGMKQSEARQSDAALVAIDRALVEAAGRPEIEAQLWGAKVDVLRAANRFQDAQSPARQALAIRERIAPDSLAAGVALYELTTVMPDEAPEYEPLSRRALQIRERLAPGSRFEADCLTNLARFADKHGDSRAAVELQLRALAIHQGLDPKSRTVARAFSGLCAFQMNRGDLAAAEDSCRRSLELSRSLGPGERAAVVQALHNMGVVARLQGDFDRAVQLFLQALEICDQIDPGGRMAGYNNFELGVTEVSRRDLERLEKAEEYLRLSEQILNPSETADSPHAALTALIRADIAYQRKDLASAEKLLRQALAYYERTAPNGPAGRTVLECLGLVLTERGQVIEAEERLRRALVLFQQIAPGSQEAAQASHDLGMLLWRTGRLVEAEVALRKAIADLESQLGKLGGFEESSSSFSAHYADFYKDYLALSMELHRDRDAFLILERLRAGSFLRTLAQREMTLPAEIPTDLDRERRLTNEAYDRTQGEIRQLNPGDDAKKIEQDLARLSELRQKQSEIAEQIRRASPRYAALRYPQALDLAATGAALDPGTALLSYSIGKEKSFLFVVSSDPKRGPALFVISIPVGDKLLRESVGALRRQIGRNEPSPDLVARSRALYDTLVKPAEALVAGHERLLVLPDGPLHTLPWAALVRGVKAGRPEYLVEWKPIHTAVSATVYAELRKSRRGGSNGPAVELAAFGDPQYPASAARKAAVLRGGDTEEIEDEVYGDPEVDAVLRGGYRFEPLPRTRQEVETIASLYAPKSEAFLGEQATEERARSIGKGVSLIHYACHAYVNERSPLDSALVFTIPAKPSPGQDNGLLQAWEIFEKVRIDADLVTLSACDSGLGKEMGGEGLIGLTRAFQYAGARSVLASLWKVEDESTADLMKRFYGYLKAGKTKDEALRLAQIDLIRSPKFSQPRDWAAFQLAGDWK